MAEVWHGWNAINLELSGHIYVFLRNSKSRPHYISFFKNLNPIIILYDRFDKFKFSSAPAGIDFDFLFTGWMFFSAIELRLSGNDLFLSLLFLIFLKFKDVLFLF
jgi:hypothetical protein